MFEHELHKIRHADLLRAADAERLARQARKAAARSAGHGSGGRVKPLQQLFDHAA